MHFTDYQIKSRRTAQYPKKDGTIYVILGLSGEAGEIANKAKKVLRGDKSIEEFIEEACDELGDVLWYLSQVAYELGWDLDYIAQRNLEKLQDRQDRGVVGGDGDDR